MRRDEKRNKLSLRGPPTRSSFPSVRTYIYLCNRAHSLLRRMCSLPLSLTRFAAKIQSALSWCCCLSLPLSLLSPSLRSLFLPLFICSGLPRPGSVARETVNFLARPAVGRAGKTWFGGRAKGTRLFGHTGPRDLSYKFDSFPP